MTVSIVILNPGFEPVQYFVLDQPSSWEREKPLLLWNGPPREFFRREPYLAFSLLFLCLKLLLYFFPGMLSRLKAFWVTYGWHLNLGIFGETSQLLGRVLNVVNLKMAWSKLKMCKARRLHNGAKNARVWASSLASVSLGESSSTRPSLDSWFRAPFWKRKRERKRKSLAIATRDLGWIASCDFNGRYLLFLLFLILFSLLI